MPKLEGWIVKRTWPANDSGLKFTCAQNQAEQMQDGNDSTPYTISLSLVESGKQVRQQELNVRLSNSPAAVKGSSLIQRLTYYVEQCFNETRWFYPTLSYNKLSLALDMLAAIDGDTSLAGGLSDEKIATFYQRAVKLQPLDPSVREIAAGRLGDILNRFRVENEGDDSNFANLLAKRESMTALNTVRLA